MDNKGNKLTQEILKNFGFKKEVFRDRDGDEVKWWYKNGVTIHEQSWWLIELDEDGEDDEFLETPLSKYSEGETPPEITFSFATYVKGDGSFKGGFVVETDQQVKNIYFSLTSRCIEDS
jgi:hypothetical protein